MSELFRIQINVIKREVHFYIHTLLFLHITWYNMDNSTKIAIFGDSYVKYHYRYTSGEMKARILSAEYPSNSHLFSDSLSHPLSLWFSQLRDT